jgi:hypothetical protein
MSKSTPLQGVLSFPDETPPVVRHQPLGNSRISEAVVELFGGTEEYGACLAAVAQTVMRQHDGIR